MKHGYFLFLSFILLFALIMPLQSAGQDTHDHPATSNELMRESEDFWASINFIKLKNEIGASLHISGPELDLYDKYLQSYIDNDRIVFFSSAPYGGILPSEYASFFNNMKQRYIAQYPQFLLVKDHFIIQLAQDEANAKAQAANGPCTNIGFEDGTLNGWTVKTGTACGTANCTQTVNTSPGCRAKVTNSSMTDPWISSLSTVAPFGGTHSVRLENFQNGAMQASLTQTFQVTAANNIFTYKYAVVLEDPVTDHTDAQRPYFTVKMYDGSGKEITCATYTRIASANYLSDYIHNPVTNPALLNASDGCQYGGTANGATSTRDLWYKDWTTVSIPLVGLEGQNVTVIFTASDCSKGGHFGYAYIDAACSAMNPLNTATICGNQSITYTATPGFADYKWAGPGIVGVDDDPTVEIDKIGNYSLTLTPISDNATKCPTTQNFTVLEHCYAPPLSDTFCENPKGSGSVSGINLNNYNTQITSYVTQSAKSVTSWHSGYPVSAANKVGTPAAPISVVVSNTTKFYALINYSPGPGSDTAQMSFVINPSPAITFPAIGPLCIGSSPVTLSASPAGGTFALSTAPGTPITQFNPSAAGTFTIIYSYTSPTTGCSNTASQTIIVQPMATVNAGADQTVCASAASVTLNGTATNATGILWSTDGQGTLSSTTLGQTAYSPSASERANGATVTVTLKAFAANPCLPVTDDLKITIIPEATVNAGMDQKVCATTAGVALTGSSTHTASVGWAVASGGNGGGLSSTNTLNSSYVFSAAEKLNGATITLILTGTAVSPCLPVTDPVVIQVVPLATVNAGAPQTVCATSVALQGTATNYISVNWKTSAGTTSTFSPVNDQVSTYIPTAAEIANGGSVTVILTAVAASPCPPVTDQTVLTISPLATVDAGIDQKLCASSASTVSLSGTATHASGGTVWTTDGGGILNSPGSLNATYSPTATELSSGAQITFTLKAIAASPCVPVTDQMVLTIVPVATVNAGTDQQICASTGSFSLAGTSTNATGGVQWTTNGGGTIVFGSSANATYLPSTAEKLSGALITMTFTATPGLPCVPVSDPLTLTVSPDATIDAGTDQLLCASGAASVPLSGSSVNTTGGVFWSTNGGGTISAPASANTSYIPSASELLSGGIITMTFTGIAASPCPQVTDQMIITIIPVATIDAGPNRIICANSVVVPLNGVGTNFTALSWSGGQGNLFPDNTISTIYIPASSELSSGATFTMTLKATAIFPCPTVQDQTTITIIPEATLEAGTDSTVCSTSSIIPLHGFAMFDSLDTWTTSGSGTFSSTNTLNPIYTLSASEIAAGGSVVLTLQVTPKNPCPVISDQVVINIVPAPGVNAGPPQDKCADDPAVILAGTVFNAFGGTWSGGSGSFNPGNQDLNAVYTPSETEINAGMASLILTTDNSPLCAPVSDTVNIAIHPLPIVNLGDDQKICPESDSPVTFNAGTGGGPGAKFIWEPAVDTTQYIHVTTPGTYKVTVFTQYGCKASASVNLNEVCPPRLFLSNSFTPNADGTNDLYSVYGVHVANFHMFIFNRWGEIIFESKDRKDAWDGMYRGVLMPIGVYPWIITYEGDTEEYFGPYRLEGSVTLVR